MDQSKNRQNLLKQHQEARSKLSWLINHHSKIVCFTGAGISTESGISDYRSKGGLWDRFQPVTIQEFLKDEDKRKEFWRRKKETYEQMKISKPNEGHLALTKLEKIGKLLGIITQNIDGLHQQAGSRQVIEIHGTNKTVGCLRCDYQTSFEATLKELTSGIEVPLCPQCGGLLKSNTISFGQELDSSTLTDAMQLAQRCELMIVIGSTLLVEPAASFPRTAKKIGAGLVIINRDSTPLDSIADLVLQEEIGPLLKAVTETL